MHIIKTIKHMKKDSIKDSSIKESTQKDSLHKNKTAKEKKINKSESKTKKESITKIKKEITKSETTKPHNPTTIPLNKATTIFKSKQQQYGNSLQHLSPQSIITLIELKLQRIKTLTTTKNLKGNTNEHINNDIIAIINYTITLHILTKHKLNWNNINNITKEHKSITKQTKQLFTNKSKDYNQQYKSLTNNTITEIIQTKLHRIKHILQNIKTKPTIKIQNETIDIINYSTFLFNNINN